MNLLRETLEILEEHGKSFDDIEFVLCKGITFSPEKARPMMDFEYDDGFGGQEVDETLKVVGKDFWLERHEYDGSEWWEYKCMPEKTGIEKGYKYETFKSNGWWD